MTIYFEFFYSIVLICILVEYFRNVIWRPFLNLGQQKKGEVLKEDSQGRESEKEIEKANDICIAFT